MPAEAKPIPSGIQAALRATGRRLEFLEKNQQNRRLIGLAVEAVLTGKVEKPAGGEQKETGTF